MAISPWVTLNRSPARDPEAELQRRILEGAPKLTPEEELQQRLQEQLRLAPTKAPLQQRLQERPPVQPPVAPLQQRLQERLPPPPTNLTSEVVGAVRGPSQPVEVTPPNPALVVQAANAIQGMRSAQLPTMPGTAVPQGDPQTAKPPKALTLPDGTPAQSMGGVPGNLQPTRDPFHEIKQSIKDKLGTVTKSTDALSDDAYKTTTDRLNELKIQALKDQEQGIKDQEARARILEQVKPQMDYSALAALVDSQTGSKFSQTYKTGNEDIRKQLQDNIGVYDKIQTRKGAFTDDQINLLKAQLGGYTTQSLLREAANAVTSTNKPPSTNGESSRENQFNREYRGQLGKLQDDVVATEASYKNIEEAMGSGDFATINLMLAQIARRISGEKGVLTDPDIQRTMPAQFEGDVAKFLTYLGQQGKVDATYTHAISSMLDFAKRTDASKFNDKLTGIKGRFQPDKHWNQSNETATDAARADVDRFAPKPPPKKKSLMQEFMEMKGKGAPSPTASTNVSIPVPAEAPAPGKKSLVQEFMEAKKKKE